MMSDASARGCCDSATLKQNREVEAKPEGVMRFGEVDAVGEADANLPFERFDLTEVR